jgi:integrase/recombinase XerD
MLQRQAKTLRQGQIQALLDLIARTRHPLRNKVIFLLSLRAGLRAKEIAHLEWGMVTDARGEVGTLIRLEDRVSKGRSGGAVPMALDLRRSLQALQQISPAPFGRNRVVQTERSSATSAQVIINLFREWYQALGFDGCSSHSGRRTFITMAARNIGRFGGSLRDVQALARHSSLAMTQRYIEIDSRAMERVVDAW